MGLRRDRHLGLGGVRRRVLARPRETEAFWELQPDEGFKVADTEHGDLSIRVFTYVRYLNQPGLDETYTNAFGRRGRSSSRQDLQFQRSTSSSSAGSGPKFRYLAYVWTANTSQGQGAQVVVAGNLPYKVNRPLHRGRGIGSLPSDRSLAGNFPNWLSLDDRQISDESSAVLTPGRLGEGSASSRGSNTRPCSATTSVSSGWTPDSWTPGMNTVTVMLDWMPTTGEFGKQEGSATTSRTTRWQPRSAFVHPQRREPPGPTRHEGFENSSSARPTATSYSPRPVRTGRPDRQGDVPDGLAQRGSQAQGVVARGRVLLAPDLQLPPQECGGGDTVRRPEGQRLPDPGVGDAAPEDPPALCGGLEVFGEYGNPWDSRLGLDWFPWKNEVVRWNFESIYVRRSPVGAFSLPYSVGADGPIFYTSLVLWL